MEKLNNVELISLKPDEYEALTLKSQHKIYTIVNVYDRSSGDHRHYTVYGDCEELREALLAEANETIDKLRDENSKLEKEKELFVIRGKYMSQYFEKGFWGRLFTSPKKLMEEAGTGFKSDHSRYEWLRR